MSEDDASNEESLSQNLEFRKGKITLHDIRAIATIVVKNLRTETEACNMLGIRVKHWWQYKKRASVTRKYEDSLARLKEFSLNAVLTRISDSAHGLNGAKYPDWRAAAWFAERMEPRLQINTNQSPAVTTTTNTLILIEAVKRAYASVEGINCDLNANNESREPKLIQSNAARTVGIPIRRPNV